MWNDCLFSHLPRLRSEDPEAAKTHDKVVRNTSHLLTCIMLFVLLFPQRRVVSGWCLRALTGLWSLKLRFRHSLHRKGWIQEPSLYF